MTNLKTEILKSKQEQFCKNFVFVPEFRNNSTLSYANAYQIDLETLKNNSKREYLKVYDNCASNASRLLRNDKIRTRLGKLLDSTLSSSQVNAQLARIIFQCKDLSVCLAAIKEYNRSRGRIK
jgi:hypothetical protein